jgi:V/A-type H+-transporting ATPase subunit I
MIFPAMGFSIMLGIIQVILGIAIQATNKIRQQGAAWGLLPISYILIILGLLNVGAYGDVLKLGSTQIGPLPVGSLLKTLPPFLGKIFIFGGLAVMFIFNSPDKKIFFRPLLGLWELYQFASELMGNVLSYLRLFALGLASGLLGNAFNQIAFMFVTDAQGNLNFASIGIIGTVFVLVFGHTLNLGLGALGSFVHPLRLTFVEFYKCVQFKGGGKAYSPFAIKRAD